MDFPAPPRPDAPKIWPRWRWLLVVAVVGGVVVNVWLLDGISDSAEQHPGTDAAGMLSLLLLQVNGVVVVTVFIAGKTRVVRWWWRRSTVYAPQRGGGTARPDL